MIELIASYCAAEELRRRRSALVSLPRPDSLLFKDSKEEAALATAKWLAWL